MQKEVRLTDEQWSVVMRCLNNGIVTFQKSAEIREQITDTQNRIYQQLRCHEAIQNMSPACPEGGKDGTQRC